MRNFLRPTYLVEAVWDIDLEALHRRGIRGLIIDLDNTIVDWNGTRLRPAVSEWIEAARRRGFRMCITSNAVRRGRAAAVAEQLGLRAVLRAGKPFPRAFRRSMSALGTAPTSTCAVGDQVFTDMVGANWLGLTTVLVRPLSRRESPHTRAIRLLERPLRRRWAAVASDPGGGEVGG